MTKSLLTLATVLLAATTMLTSAAEAGFKVRLGFGGPLPSFTAYGNSGSYGRNCHKRAYRTAHYDKAPVRVSRKAALSAPVAQADEKSEADTAPVTVAAVEENSSIVVGPTEPAKVMAETKAVEPVKTASATPSEAPAEHKIDCKKFFPSVGMTLSVPCE
jgi:hypothetical protein